jgi:hypothetical protein
LAALSFAVTSNAAFHGVLTVAAYNESLAQKILLALEEEFPVRLSSHDLKTRVADFTDVSDQEWLFALDALLKMQRVDGKALRTGFSGTLQDIVNLEITSLGRNSIRSTS